MGGTSTGITPPSLADETRFVTAFSDPQKIHFAIFVREEMVFALITALGHVNMEFNGLKIEQRAQGK